MIPEDRQDLAALYVLGSLDARETADFEVALQNDAELRALVVDLREGAAVLALTAPDRSAPAALRQRVLRDIAVEKSGGNADSVSVRSISWWPWAIAALFMISCAFLLYDRDQLQRKLDEVRTRDPLAEMKFVALTPQKEAPPDAKAMAAWQPSEQAGMIRVSGLPLIPGKDYQLWVIDENYKDPVSAGIVHVNPDGVAEVHFKPVAATYHVKAFAISLEREGGMPKPEGPILLVGNMT